MQSDEFKRRREKLKMTQAQIAKELKVDVMTVSRWERGAVNIPAIVEVALETVERKHR